MKSKSEKILENIDIVGIMIIVIANLVLKQWGTVWYQLGECIGASLVFAQCYVHYKMGESQRDKAFFGLGMIAIMVACLSIFTW